MRQSHSDRIGFLDNVRYWTVLTVVVLHVGMSQMTIPWGWPVEDPRRMEPATWIVVITASFVMPVLFFVAGYFALPSLGPKGPARFLWAKIKRLVIPGALVVVFLNPIFRYVYHYTRGFNEEIPVMSYWQFWPRFFDGAFSVVVWQPATLWTPEFSTLHIWFVTVLFVFFAATAAVVAVRPSFGGRPSPAEGGAPSTRSPVTLLIVATLIGWAGSFAIATFWKSAWVRFGPFLSFFAPDIPFHVAYYCLGVAAYRRHWFKSSGRLGNVWVWSLVCVALSPMVCALVDRQLADPALATDHVFQAVSGLCNWFLCMGFLGFLLTLGETYFNCPTRFSRHMASHSYRTYLVHMAVVVLVQFALWKWSTLTGTTVLVLGMIFSLVGSHAAALLVGNMQTWMTLRAAREYRISTQVEAEAETG